MLTKTKKPSIPWKRAKAIPIPIPKTGTKFKQYPDMPLRPCEVTASFQYVPIGQAWYWRFKLDTPLMHHGDPQANDRRPAVSSDKAIEAALAKILECLREEVELRRHHKQTEIAGACAEAVFHVQEFVKYFRETGKFRYKPIVPGGTKPREEFDAEVEAVQRPRPTTAIAVRQTAVVEATVVENLNAEERRELKANETKIERGGRAWLEMGIALGEINTKRLYRQSHSTFEAYCLDRWHIKRSIAYGLMDAAKKHQAALPIAEELGLEFTSESQLRPLRGVEPSGLKPVLQRVARLTEPDHDGVKRPTAKIVSRSVHDENTSPDDLKREREAAKMRAAHKHQGLDAEPGMFARGPQPIAVGHLTEDQEEILLPERPLPGPISTTIMAFLAEFGRQPVPESAGYWNGEADPEAVWLHLIRATVERIRAQHLGSGNEKFRMWAKQLLWSLGDEIESGKLPGLDAPHDAGRELDGRVWKEMPHGQRAPKAARRAK